MLLGIAFQLHDSMIKWMIYEILSRILFSTPLPHSLLPLETLSLDLTRDSFTFGFEKIFSLSKFLFCLILSTVIAR